jgi:hypothetical protein
MFMFYREFFQQDVDEYGFEEAGTEQMFDPELDYNRLKNVVLTQRAAASHESRPSFTYYIFMLPTSHRTQLARPSRLLEETLDTQVAISRKQ